MKVFNDNLPEEAQAFLRNYYQESGIDLENCDDRIQFLKSRVKTWTSLSYFPDKIDNNVKKRIELFELERRLLIGHGYCL